MKITMVTASYRGGGAERVQISLAQSFYENGHDVSFLTFEDYGELKQILPKHIPTVCLNSKQVSKGLFSLAQYLRKNKPDVIIVAMIYVGITAILAKAISRWSGKIIIRADSSAKYIRNNSSMLNRMIMDLSQMILLPHAHAVVGVSNAITREYQTLYKISNCVTINNPVSLLPNPIQNCYLHPFFSGPDPVILALGRLHKVKGFNFLLDSFAELLQKTKAKLIILGEGKERLNLEHKIVELGIHDDVSFPGYTQFTGNFLQSATVFAISSQSEAFGLSLVEAMNAGTPIVCTNTAGPREILNEGALGPLIKFGDVSSYARALKTAIEQPDQLQMERKKRARDFEPDLIAKQYVKMIVGDAETFTLNKSS